MLLFVENFLLYLLHPNDFETEQKTVHAYFNVAKVSMLAYNPLLGVRIQLMSTVGEIQKPVS